MTYLDLLKSLIPQGCYSDEGSSEVLKDLAVQANALDACQNNGSDIFEDEMFPDKVDELLPHWERTYGIAPDNEVPYSARIDNLLANIRATGGLTRAYFIELAAKLGYSVTIDEFEPFMAGWSEAGDEIYIEDIVYVWQVNVTPVFYLADGSVIADGSVVAGGNSVNLKTYYFEAGISAAGDYLSFYTNEFFESIFNKLKPAHTACVFVYQ